MTLDEENFEANVLQSTHPVLVDFWAEWCGPCKMMSPILDELADSAGYTGKIKIAKLDVDKSPNIAARYNVRGIPTLMIFKNGQLEGTKVGAMSKSQLTAFIDENV